MQSRQGSTCSFYKRKRGFILLTSAEDTHSIYSTQYLQHSLVILWDNFRYMDRLWRTSFLHCELWCFWNYTDDSVAESESTSPKRSILARQSSQLVNISSNQAQMTKMPRDQTNQDLSWHFYGGFLLPTVSMCSDEWQRNIWRKWEFSSLRNRNVFADMTNLQFCFYISDSNIFIHQL